MTSHYDLIFEEARYVKQCRNARRKAIREENYWAQRYNKERYRDPIRAQRHLRLAKCYRNSADHELVWAREARARQKGYEQQLRECFEDQLEATRCIKSARRSAQRRYA